MVEFHCAGHGLARFRRVAVSPFARELADRLGDHGQSARPQARHPGRYPAGCGWLGTDRGCGQRRAFRPRDFLPIIPALSPLPATWLAGRDRGRDLIGRICESETARAAGVPVDLPPPSFVRFDRVARTFTGGSLADCLRRTNQPSPHLVLESPMAAGWVAEPVGVAAAFRGLALAGGKTRILRS